MKKKRKRKAFQCIDSALQNRTFILFCAVALFLASIGIAAYSSYADSRKKPSGSSPSVNIPYNDFYAYLEERLPQYGVVPQEEPLFISGLSGVFAAYMPTACDEMLICRMEGKDLILEQCRKNTDSSTDEPFIEIQNTTRISDVFEKIYLDSPLIIRIKPEGVFIGTEFCTALQSPDYAEFTLASISLEEKKRSWELSSYRVRDFSAFRSKVSLPAEKPLREVPDVSELNWEEAVKLLDIRGFSPRIEPLLQDNTSCGTVLAQSPEGGVRRSAGSDVFLTVSAESFLFSLYAPPHANGNFTVILYDSIGDEITRQKLQITDSSTAQPYSIHGIKYQKELAFQAVLVNEDNQQTVSLGAYTVQTEPVIANETVAEYTFRQVSGISEPETTCEATELPPYEEDHSAAWKAAYRQYLQNGLKNGFSACNKNSLRCELIDLDGDAVPELAVGAYEQNRQVTWICSIRNGEVLESEHFPEKIWYLEGKNRIFLKYRSNYSASSQICTLKNGQTEILQSFEEHWSKDNSYTYKADAVTITREDYAKGLDTFFNLPERTEWEYPKAGWPLNDDTMKKYLQ